MASATAIVGVAYLLTGAGLLVLLREPLRRPDKPGSTGFALAVLGISLWPLSLGVNYFVAGFAPSMALWTVRLSAASVVSVGWFLVAAEVTGRLSLSRTVAATAVAYVLVELSLVVTNGTHGLVFGPATTLDGSIPVVAYGPWFWLQTALNYGLIAVGTGLLVAEWSRSSGLRRRQTAVLSVAVAPPVVANLATLFGPVPTVHDLTPFGLVGSGLLLSWALYRAEFLDIVPVARQVAMAEMQDAVVTLDDEDRVVDCNRAARAQFDIPPSYAGDPIGTYFPSLADAPATDGGETLADGDDSAADGGPSSPAVVTRTVDGDSHSYSVSVSPVVEAGRTVARVVVLRDITPIKRREQELTEREAELELLRQILSRVLRHNIRNKLTTIRGNADLLAEGATGDDAARVGRIVEASDELIALSEKAGTIEHLVDRPDETATYDLRVVAERVVARVRDRYPDASYVVSGSETCTVETASGVESAVECLVENAVEHNDASDPTVRVAVGCAPSGAEIRVSDDGPGISEHEREVIRRREETPLAHSSGIGLWIVSWVADRCEAELSFDVDETGSTVSLRFASEN
ncbi:ATP-binding protein [Halosimplex rubrum]|uniref:histidine kinase n=1 Tax=Halosimplex rubrum TaxID=869889 RepID=A0A7D5P6Y5_9EURY|nr:histidine kinase N-terminal 7TM domain-containing protein [Halosimplex rubrum]QLH79385.1 ATP-binding protein [Halosimplex rubrum]